MVSFLNASITKNSLKKQGQHFFVFVVPNLIKERHFDLLAFDGHFYRIILCASFLGADFLGNIKWPDFLTFDIQ
jgi:hypothetical protein